MALIPPTKEGTAGANPVVNTYRSGDKFYDVPLSDDAIFRKNMPRAERMYSFSNGVDTFDVKPQEVGYFLQNMPRVKPLHNYDLSFLQAAPPSKTLNTDYEETLNLISAAESGGKNIPNQGGTSRAWGHYQIVPDTFEGIKNKYPELSYETWEDFQKDTDLQKRVASRLLEDIDSTLTANRIPTTKENRYYMWFSGNPRLATADGQADISTVLTPRQIRANHLEGMSVDQVRGMLDNNLKRGQGLLMPKQAQAVTAPIDSQLPTAKPQKETGKEPLGKIDQLKVEYFKKTRGEDIARKKEDEIRQKNAPIPGWDEKSGMQKFTTGVKAGWEGAKGGTKYSYGVMMEGLDRLDGESDWDYDNRVMKSARKNFAAVPPGRGVWYQLGSFTPQMIGIAAAAASAPFTAGTSAAAVPSIIAGGNIGLLVAQSAGGAMNEYDQYMKHTGQKTDYWTRLGVGIGAGSAEYLAERIGISRYLPDGVMSKAFSKFLTTQGTDIAEKIAKTALKNNPTLDGFLIRTLKNMAEEGAEESLTEAGQILIETMYKNPQDRADFNEWTSRLSQAFGGGALMGGVLSPITYTAGIAYENKVKQLNEALIDQPEQGAAVQPTDPFDNLYVDPRTVVEAQARQRAGNLGNPDNGIITIVREKTTNENIPGREWYVQKGHPTNMDGSMTVWDGNPNGESKFLTKKQLGGKPIDLTQDEYVKRMLTLFDQQQAEDQLREQNKMRYNGKVYTKPANGHADEDTETWVDENQNPVSIPKKAIQEWQNGQDKPRQTDSKGIQSRVFDKAEYYGSIDETGSFHISQPMRRGEVAEMIENVQKETGGKSVVVDTPVEEQDATQPMYNVKVVPWDNLTLQEQQQHRLESDLFHDPEAEKRRKEEEEKAKQPTYKFMGEEVSREEAETVINLAGKNKDKQAGKKELEALEYKNDPALDKLIEHHFPKPKPAYSKGKEKLTSLEAKIRIKQSKNIQDLKEIKVENDPEMQELWDRVARSFSPNTVNFSDTNEKKSTETPSQTIEEQEDKEINNKESSQKSELDEKPSTEPEVPEVRGPGEPAEATAQEGPAEGKPQEQPQAEVAKEEGKAPDKEVKDTQEDKKGQKEKKYAPDFKNNLPKVEVPDYVYIKDHVRNIENRKENGIYDQSYAWKFKLDSGDEVEVAWRPLWSNTTLENGYEHKADHFKFFGSSISSTGFFSHFVNQTFVDTPFKEVEEEVKRFAEKLYQERQKEIKKGNREKRKQGTPNKLESASSIDKENIDHSLKTTENGQETAERQGNGQEELLTPQQSMEAAAQNQAVAPDVDTNPDQVFSPSKYPFNFGDENSRNEDKQRSKILGVPKDAVNFWPYGPSWLKHETVDLSQLGNYIVLAQTPNGQWQAGYSINWKDGSDGTKPGSTTSAWFRTREEALKDGLGKYIKQFSGIKPNLSKKRAELADKLISEAQEELGKLNAEAFPALAEKENEKSKQETNKLNREFEQRQNEGTKGMSDFDRMEAIVSDKLSFHKKLSDEELSWVNENYSRPEGYSFDQQGDLIPDKFDPEIYPHMFHNGKLLGEKLEGEELAQQNQELERIAQEYDKMGTRIANVIRNAHIHNGVRINMDFQQELLERHQHEDQVKRENKGKPYTPENFTPEKLSKIVDSIFKTPHSPYIPKEIIDPVVKATNKILKHLADRGLTTKDAWDLPAGNFENELARLFSEGYVSRAAGQNLKIQKGHKDANPERLAETLQLIWDNINRVNELLPDDTTPKENLGIDLQSAENVEMINELYPVMKKLENYVSNDREAFENLVPLKRMNQLEKMLIDEGYNKKFAEIITASHEFMHKEYLESLDKFKEWKNESLRRLLRDLKHRNIRIQRQHVQWTLDHAKYTPRHKNSRIERLNIFAVEAVQDEDYRVERGNSNELKGRIDSAKDYLLSNPKELEASIISFRSDGKIDFEDGRHRIIAARELGAEFAYFEIKDNEQQNKYLDLFMDRKPWGSLSPQTPLDQEMLNGRNQREASKYLTGEDYKVIKKGTEITWGKYPTEGDPVFISLEAESLNSQDKVYKNISLDPAYPMSPEWGERQEKLDEGNRVMVQRMRDQTDRRISNRYKIPVEPKEPEQPIEPTLSADELRLKELADRMRKLLPPADQVQEPEAQYGNNPSGELLAIGSEMAFLHIKMGKTGFVDFARKMVKDLGPAVKPYLKSFYNAARDFPGMEEYEPQMDEYSYVKKLNLEEALSIDAAEKFSVQASWKSFVESLSTNEDLVTMIEGKNKQNAMKLLEDYLRDYAEAKSNVFITQYNDLFVHPFANKLFTLLVAHGLKTRKGFLIPTEKPEQVIDTNQKDNLTPDENNLLGQLDKLHPEEAPLNVTKNTGLQVESISERAFVVKGNTKPLAQDFRDTGGIWQSKHQGWMYPKSRQKEIEQRFGITPKAESQYPENKKAYVASIINKITTGEKIINTPALTNLASQAGLKAGIDYRDIKELYDLASSALNQHILSLNELNPNGMEAEDVKIVLDYLDDISDLLPTETQRSREQVELQQYSTPLSLAYLVNWVAQPGKGETVLEPSAGEGNLAIFAKLSGASVIANEIDPRRLELLKLLGLRTTAVDAKHVHLMPVLLKERIHTVVMNPPFSRDIALGNALDLHAAEKHIGSALQKLEPGGRLVAIVGRGMSLDSISHRPWWRKIANQYLIRANIALPGEAYRRKGTSFDNRLVVIDKAGATVDEPITGNVNNYSELVDILQTIDPKQRINQANENTHRNRQTEADPAHGGLPGTRDRQPDDGSPNGSTDQGTGDVAPGGHGSMADAPQRPGRGGLSHGRGGRSHSGGGHSGSKASKSGNTPGSGRGSFTGGLNGRNEGKDVTFEPAKPLELEYADRTIEISDKLGYEPYTPEIKVKGSQAHPTALVESTAMASVPLPKVKYRPLLSPTVIQSGALSEAQLEDVILAGASHENTLPSELRQGFFLGGGTGYGKGRTVAAIIQDNFNRGRKKAIWISANNKAHYDSVDYWKAVGGDEDMIFKQKDGKTAITRKEGLLMTTYGTLKTKFDPRANYAENPGFWTNPHESRLQQIAQWLGADYDGVIVFDESHNMANSQAKKGERGTKDASMKALAGIELQKLLPNARVVYASATGATEVSNLLYATRLGLWGDGTSFNNQNNFLLDMEVAGVAGMEIIAKDLKAMGLYTAKQISFEGVQYQTLEHKLTAEQKALYNQIADAWQMVYHHVEDAIERNQASNQAKRNAKSAFWGSQQRFFSQVIMTMQLPTVLKEMQVDLVNDKSVIVQLISTNEAITTRALAEARGKLSEGEELDYDDLDLSPKSILLDFLRNSYPIHQFEERENEQGEKYIVQLRDENDKPIVNPESVRERDALIDRLSRDLALPESPLDILINTFGADNVAEVTGRTRRIVQRGNEKGELVKAEEARTESHNEQDKDAFMDGKKRILIFSKAGGTGASFHSDLSRKNQQQRSHYVLQVGWRADDAIQGFGRSHRSNQRIAPIFKLVTTDLKAQRRFLSSVSRRLDQLGALTKGQRQAGGQGILDSSFNLEGRYAEQALFNFYRNVEDARYPGIDMDVLQNQMAVKIYYENAEGGREYNMNVMTDTKMFLNRIMTLRVDLMDQVFEAYMQSLATEVERAKETGRYDEGIEIVKALSTRVVDQKVIHVDPKTGGKSYLTKFELEVPNEKTTWDNIQFKVKLSSAKFLGYYEEPTSERIYAMQEYSEIGADAKTVKRIVRRSVVADATVTREELKQKYKKIDNLSIAERYWNKDYAEYPDTRKKVDYIVKGLILPIWSRLPGYINVRRYIDDAGTGHLGR